MSSEESATREKPTVDEFEAKTQRLAEVTQEIDDLIAERDGLEEDLRILAGDEGEELERERERRTSVYKWHYRGGFSIFRAIERKLLPEWSDYHAEQSLKAHRFWAVGMGYLAGLVALVQASYETDRFIDTLNVPYAPVWKIAGCLVGAYALAKWLQSGPADDEDQ